MKLNGKELKLYKQRILDIEGENGEIYSFTLTPPATSFSEKLESLFPSPNPPKEFSRNKKGMLERDENGKVIVIKNEEDKTYKDELRQNIQLQSVAMVYEVIKNDKNIEFDAKLENFPNEKDFFVALRKEIAETLPFNVFTLLLRTASNMMNIDEKTLEEAEATFQN